MKRTFKVIDTECLACTDKDYCGIAGIDRDHVFQSLADAKLYVVKHCSISLLDILVEVKEETK